MAVNPLTLNHFAVEILFEIASNATQTEQMALSTVSKTFNAVAAKFLYRHIVLTSFRRIFRFCDTLEKKTEAALAVRTLSFDLLGHAMISGKWNVAIFEPFFRMINRALLKTTRLYSLVLRLPHDPRGMILQNCTFPSLNHYGSTFDSGGDFVERNPVIKNITVLGEGLGPDTMFDSAHVPSLNVFSGPAHLVPTVVPGRPVHSAKLWWPLYPCYETAEDGLDRCSAAIIKSLAQSTFPTGIAILENLFMDWPPMRTIDALATSLNLRVLFIRSRNCGERAYHMFLFELQTVLPQFQQLQEIGVTFLSPCGNADLQLHRDKVAELVEEFWTIREWANRCPTIRVCTLQSSTPWLRFRLTSPSFWVPLHPEERVFARVFADTMWKEAYENLRAWERFCRNCLALYAQLPRGTGLFLAMHSQVVAIQSFGDLIPPLLDS
ncbi:hypothetical protein B0H17DRAFT_1206882 [Mycena rosella]|uniref:F-box domain-containing protein n=1 Tax=Mycena rosella TaxID=1033263 RepID=A0AAD7G8G4_MYCRO|nr:hypothetical protein B0H17DRAFT_1206882 [Mycena rosella]